MRIRCRKRCVHVAPRPALPAQSRRLRRLGSRRAIRAFIHLKFTAIRGQCESVRVRRDRLRDRDSRQRPGGMVALRAVDAREHHSARGAEPGIPWKVTATAFAVGAMGAGALAGAGVGAVGLLLPDGSDWRGIALAAMLGVVVMFDATPLSS